MRIRDRKDETPFDLESELRALRPARKPEFSASLAARVREQLGRDPSRPRRLALAVAFTVAVAVAFASIGGLGYAASTSKRAAVAVRDVVYPAKQSRRAAASRTPAQAQYQVTICHKTANASKPWVQISVSTSVVNTYLRRGDFLVTPSTPCPPPRGAAARARCSITSISGRRVAMSCIAGKARAGKRCSIKVNKTVVSRGRVGKDGRYSAKFTAPTFLKRGTTIFFLVEGKVLVTLRLS